MTLNVIHTTINTYIRKKSKLFRRVIVKAFFENVVHFYLDIRSFNLTVVISQCYILVLNVGLFVYLLHMSISYLQKKN